MVSPADGTVWGTLTRSPGLDRRFSTRPRSPSDTARLKIYNIPMRASARARGYEARASLGALSRSGQAIAAASLARQSKGPLQRPDRDRTFTAPYGKGLGWSMT